MMTYIGFDNLLIQILGKRLDSFESFLIFTHCKQNVIIRIVAIDYIDFITIKKA
jgi:hypothetical protein